jgi:hypothetical protein
MIVVPGTTHGVILRAGGRKGETMSKRKHARNWSPRGSYLHPAGGYILPGGRRPGDRIRVTAHLKAEPDTEKLARAIVELAKHLDKKKRTKDRP